MRDLDNFKRTLGPVGEKYTAAQLEEVRRQMCGMVDLLLDIYLTGERNIGGVDADSVRGTIKSQRSTYESPLG